MNFREKILAIQGRPLRAEGVGTLQVNMGNRCNMHCTHCHVSAGPREKKQMERETVEDVIAALRRNEIKSLDITGGAPELNPHFRYLVETARALGTRVVVRTNLTVFFEDALDSLPEFYARNSVEIVASLPCYTEAGVDAVRGRGAFQKSVRALRTSVQAPESAHVIYLTNKEGPYRTSAGRGLYLPCSSARICSQDYSKIS